MTARCRCAERAVDGQKIPITQRSMDAEWRRIEGALWNKLALGQLSTDVGSNHVDKYGARLACLGS